MSWWNPVKKAASWISDQVTGEADETSRSASRVKNEAGYPADQERVDQMEPLVWSTQRGLDRTGNELGRLQDQTPLVNTQQARADINNLLLGVARKNLAFAAERGLVHSGALTEAQQVASIQRAQAQAALVGNEQATRASRLQSAEQSLSVAQDGRRQFIESALQKDDKGRIRQMAVTPERYKQIDDQIKKQQRIIDELDRNRPTPDLMRRSLRGAIDSVLAEDVAAMQADARRRGFSEEYVQSIPAQMQAQRDSLYGKVDQYAEALVTDPAALQATLAALYTPEKIKQAEIEQANPVYGLIGGILGAAGGFVLTGSPAGALAGYQVGSGVGSAAGLEG